MSTLPFAGLTVCVTGDVTGFSRASAQALVEQLGGKAVSGMSAKLGLLVVGDGAGLSKLDTARRNSTRTLPAAAMVALAADPGSWDGLPVGTHPPPPAPQVASRPMRTHRIGSASLEVRGNWRVRVGCRCGENWLAATSNQAADAVCPNDPDFIAPEPEVGADVTVPRDFDDYLDVPPVSGGLIKPGERAGSAGAPMLVSLDFS